MTAAVFQLKKVKKEIDNQHFEAAMSLLNEIKGSRVPVQDTDFLRAQCFLNKGQPWSAIAALREELRWYPDNGGAAALLAELTAQYSGPVNSALGDAEFQRILEAVEGYTMLTEARLWSLFSLAKEVCAQDLPGQFVECGVAAGGSSALLASVIAQKSKQARRLYAFDSLEGMPASSDRDQHNGQAADDTGGAVALVQRLSRHCLPFAAELVLRISWNRLKAGLRILCRGILRESDQLRCFTWTETGTTLLEPFFDTFMIRC